MTLPTPPLPLLSYLPLWLPSVLSLLPAYPLLKNGSPLLSLPAFRNLVPILNALAHHPEELVRSKLDALIRQEMAEVLTGIHAATTEAARMPVSPAPKVIWHSGSVRLLDYAPDASPSTPILLCIPSLINRAYIFDLTASRSFVRYAAARGVRPLVVEWNEPEPSEYSFSVEDYILERLEPAFLHVRRAMPEAPLFVLGYCMGGLMALALAARQLASIRGLLLLATPWDFHAPDYRGLLPTPEMIALCDASKHPIPLLPASFVQSLFYVLYPHSVTQKFKQFSDMSGSEDAKAARNALEFWVNDGLPMTFPVARTALSSWLFENQPYLGQWEVGGVRVDVSTLALRVFLALPSRDHIVPMSVSSPLVTHLSNAAMNILTPFSGHVGMIAGQDAETMLWEPCVHWLLMQRDTAI